MTPAPHPTLLGVDVLYVATLLAAVAAFAVLVAIYAATTVRDPMAKRVKALNERREQLKAGITASTSKRRRQARQRNETADQIRTLLGSLKVLQDEQLRRRSRQADAGGHPLQGSAPSRHLRPAGDADRASA